MPDKATDVKIAKPKGRPKGTGSANPDTKMLRVIATPRQARLLALLRSTWGMSESEHVRRALDMYLDGLLAIGELVDPGATPHPLIAKAE